jgi:hypothetical protein
VIGPVVDGWAAVELLPANITKVRKFIADFQPDSVHVFSFAIWNAQELDGFNTSGTRRQLELAIGRPLEEVPTVDDDIIAACCAQMGLSRATVDFQECSNFWSKQGAFRHFMRARITRRRRHLPALSCIDVALLDDVVYNETLVWPNLNASVHQFNIDEL